MNKELEELECIKDITHEFINHPLLEKAFKTIGLALERLYEIDNAESKDILNSLERLAMPDDVFSNECKKLGIDKYYDYNNIKNALLELTKIKVLNDKFDCPLDIIINACENGFIAKHYSDKYYGDLKEHKVKVNSEYGIIVDFKNKKFTDNYANDYLFKDYKITWWL